MKAFENRRIRGAISIFLVIITIPTMLFAAVLVDGSRMASARAITQEAADLAAVSALAEYNLDLKEDYGLFAIEDSENVEQIYRESLEATLLASGIPGAEEYSQQVWEILKMAVGAGNAYEGKDFLNLYDFSVDSCQVTPKYSLAEWQVLENQMVEYSKFRGLYVMADRLSLFSQLGEAKSQAEQLAQTAEAMEDKMDVDEKNAAADKALSELREKLTGLNTAIENAGLSCGSYEAILRSKMKQIRLNNVESEDTLSPEEEGDAALYDSCRRAVKDSLGKLDDAAKSVLDKAEQAKKEVQKGIERLNSFQSENSGTAAGNSDVASLVEDARQNVERYETVYLPKIEEILDDDVIRQLSTDRTLGDRVDQIMDEIDEAIFRYEKELEEMERENEEDEDAEDDEEEEILEYYYYYLDSDERTEDAEYVAGTSSLQCYMGAVVSELVYFLGASWDTEQLNPTRDAYAGTTTDRIDPEFVQSQSGTKTGEDNDSPSEKRKEVSQEVYNSRPSKTFASKDGSSAGSDFYNTSGDLTASKAILDQGKNGSMVQQVGEAVRDDVLSLSYMFGTFKTRMTGVEKFSKSGMSQADQDSFYMPKWRYAHEEGELDMRFTPKKDRETVLRGEIEYLIFGNRTDAANENSVYAAIYAERLLNNVIALYAEKTVVNPACHAAALVLSGTTGFIVPEPVFFWIVLGGWAIAETTMDMNYLIQGGYRIPLIKTNKNILLNDFPDGEGMISHYGETGIFVCYEDYLLMMLLIAGQEKRLMRSADLIEMNMKKKQSDFTMAGAYTYLYGETEFSTRYLFGSVMPFQENYEEGGVSGRMRFKNSIYLGY
ncbi:hypothetical protein B5E84_11325 [Lachnoclostridium sp. An14]|uniref:DUF5702 domain-containing protein n=1 Tax=Lachnoclostridium sp. An14 TaxID=1965562 RepID=UPI000B390F04|nr:DUF5702 domain-containing protein [Lachnoclostridium sp. An14]OUQ16803.1 hypothetical protein B5E84_11325 [Lachnoclostridium sp. An14]